MKFKMNSPTQRYMEAFVVERYQLKNNPYNIQVNTSILYVVYIYIYIYIHTYIQGESLARGPKLLSMYTVEQCGFLVRKYWQTGSFETCQTAFRTEFGERCSPSKCSIQKLVKKLETRGRRSNACRLLSLGPIEGQSVHKYTPPPTIEQFKDAIRQEIQAVKTSFSIDYEQVLFCIIPGMCI